MSDPVMVGRQLDAELIQIVRLFCRRRKWRHILSMTIGAILLILGSGVIAAHLTHHTLSNTPAIGVGGGLYAAGVLLFAWGAAAGFTSRLATWLPASIVFGMLAALVFVLMSVFASESDQIFYNGGSQGGSTYKPTVVQRASSPTGSNRVLAAELLDPAEVARFLGPAPADLHTPGEHIARTRSFAIWRSAPSSTPADARPGSAANVTGTAAAATATATANRPSQWPALSLSVLHSARQADKLWRGYCPSGAQPVQGLPGGYVRHRNHPGNTGNVTRVRAGRGEWVVALQLRTPPADEPTRLLAATVARLVDLLNAASSH